MESQNKVMTVSYGTFSCTLDGFDDPFTTMQLVAEYFRKLAAEDRYFGGEPLQPDHNALHKIAQDANPYKVDAEVTDTGVTLRKADVVDADAAPTRVSNAPAPEQAPVDETPAPLFTSKRAPAETTAETPATPDTVPETNTVDEDTASFVEAAVFSSRRGALAAAESEPEKSAAELIAEEDNDENGAEIEQAAELEAIKAQIKEDVIAEDTDATDAVAETPAEKPKAADDIQREEAALERLLETTNSKLDNPAHARKSNALERLKAAVAATEAERRLRNDPAKTERPKVQKIESSVEFKSRMSEVRRTHEDVVKISRPKSKKTGDRARGAIATLILGKDQRVGKDAAEAAAPVKKPAADGQQTAERTVERAKPALKIVRPEPDNAPASDQPAAQKTSEFARFANQIGATTLHELLEASAAYISIVENKKRYSQGRIIGHVSKVMDKSEFSKEAASRSLNRLMREGRILRVKKDRFTISKSAKSGYQNRLAG